jgi:hypothetical protein
MYLLVIARTLPTHHKRAAHELEKVRLCACSVSIPSACVRPCEGARGAIARNGDCTQLSV